MEAIEILFFFGTGGLNPYLWRQRYLERASKADATPAGSRKPLTE